MLGIQVRQQRFNLYHLDEGEMFIKEFAVNCQFVYPSSENVENLPGVLYFGSRSLIFEPDDINYSIIKFHFRYITDRPKIIFVDYKEIFKFYISKMIEIPQGKNTQPYKTYDVKSDVFIYFLFEKVEIVAMIFYELIDKYNSKQTIFEFDSVEYLGNLYSFKFDYTRLKSIHEKCFLKSELFVKKILPLIEVPGLLMLTDMRIYFQPLYKLNTKKSISIKYLNINKIFRRKVGLRDVGLEILSARNKNFFILAENEADREMLYEIINSHSTNSIEKNLPLESLTKLWVEGAISNYEYLIELNSLANRTRNDMSQYPVFPWIISNYESSVLDLNDPSIFRDLSKPIGALNPKRLEMFRERFRQMPEPKFLYGTHYSNPAYVIGYLARKYPHYMLKLHGGKFDHPDRLFNSIDIDWEICYTNPGSLKELIPEFYEDNPDFLMNLLDIDFGYNSKNEKVGHVKLPHWANDAVDFLKKMRAALETSYVSNNLHLWIDLIFGYKQKGQPAIDADNCKKIIYYLVFHPLTYETGTDLNSTDPNLYKIMQVQIIEFGQVPKQLFKNPHPKRFTNKIPDIFFKEDNMKLSINQISLSEDNIKENNTIIPFQTEDKVIYTNTNTNSNTIIEPEKEIFFNFDRNYATLRNFHKKTITSSALLPDSKIFVTGSDDGYIKIFDYKARKVRRMFNISSFPITCMAAMNLSTLVAIGSADSMIHMFNTSIGKEVNSFYAHEDTIVNVFYSLPNNILITDGADNTCKIWDLQTLNKIPCNVFYETESPIMSSDFRNQDNCHVCMSQDGLLVFRNIQSKGELHKRTLDKKHYYRYVKFNWLNDYQYFICSQEDFKIFDTRTHFEIDTVPLFANSVNIFNDSKCFFLVKDTGLSLYTISSLELVKEWNEFQNLTHANMRSVNYENPDVILLGNDFGDVFYSNISF